MCSGAEPNGSSGRLAVVAGFSNWLPGRAGSGFSLCEVGSGMSGEHTSRGVRTPLVLLMHLALGTVFPSLVPCHLSLDSPQSPGTTEPLMSETKRACVHVKYYLVVKRNVVLTHAAPEMSLGDFRRRKTIQ